MSTGVVALTATGAASASAATVWPSHSSYTYNYNYSYSEMFNAPHTGLVVANLYNDSDTTVYMRCWTTGQNFYANYWSTRWFLVTLPDGYTNWVPSGYVQNQATVPAC
jgi:hypothetical protein